MDTEWIDYRAWHHDKKVMIHVSGIDGTKVGRSHRKDFEPGHLSADRSVRANYRKRPHGSKSHGWKIGA